jgi:hypothetical protein
MCFKCTKLAVLLTNSNRMWPTTRGLLMPSLWEQFPAQALVLAARDNEDEKIHCLSSRSLAFCEAEFLRRLVPEIRPASYDCIRRGAEL